MPRPGARFPIGVGVSVAPLLMLVSVVSSTPVSAERLATTCARVRAVVRCTFAYNGTDGSDGRVQSFTVPRGVRSVTVEAWGAQGGNGGGFGGHAKGTLKVVPGEVARVRVGGSPAGSAAGFDGGGSGGGGGASDVRLRSDALGNRVVVAGGGGAPGLLESVELGIRLPLAGGAGGGSAGAGGQCTFPQINLQLPECGSGGTSTSGGGPGSSSCDSPLTTMSVLPAGGGSFGAGGAAGSVTCGIGGPVFGATSGAGGGGGWFGGGGGGGDVSLFPVGDIQGAGGGGSGFVNPAATGAVDEAGTQAGHGLVTISYRHSH